MTKLYENFLDKFEKVINEEEFTDETPEPEDEVGADTTIQIFYNDLDTEGRRKVLQGIDDAYDRIDIFSDDIAREKAEDILSKVPLLIISGQDLVTKSGIDF